MQKKLGKQIKLKLNDNFTTKYGTINYLTPQSIFISINSWAKPKHNLRFEKKLKILNKQVNDQINRSINADIFYLKHIVEFDIRLSGLQKDKQSFFALEITLYPKKISPFPNDIYDKNVHVLINDVISNIKKNRDFTFSAKKLNNVGRTNEC